jgi:predicted nucleotidyltransferase component of viral defense system
MHRECFPKRGWKVLRSLKDTLTKYNAILAGGTALALHMGHRISEDLDFFTDVEFRVESIILDIRKTNHPFRIISEGEGYLIIDVGGIKISIFKYDYPFLEKPIIYKGIRIAGVLDTASMKVIAISQRGTKRDFVDLYFILQDMPFHKIANHMVRRFGKERINPIHIGKSLVYFSDAESNPEPQYMKGRDISWDKVKKFFRQHVKQFVLDIETAIKDYK